MFVNMGQWCLSKYEKTTTVEAKMNKSIIINFDKLMNSWWKLWKISWFHVLLFYTDTAAYSQVWTSRYVHVYLYFIHLSFIDFYVDIELTIIVIIKTVGSYWHHKIVIQMQKNKRGWVKNETA